MLRFRQQKATRPSLAKEDPLKYFKRDELPLFNAVQISDGQMRALQNFISASRDATPFAKRAILYAMAQSKNLTERVSLSVKAGMEASELLDGASRVNSSLCSTNINLFLEGMGTEFGLSEHFGIYVKPGVFDSSIGGATIWISPFFYDHGAQNFDYVKVFEMVELQPLPGIDCQRTRRLYGTMLHGNDLSNECMEELRAHLNSCPSCSATMKSPD